VNSRLLSVPRTPPHRPERSLNAVVSPGKSPSRALSVPLEPVHRDALDYDSNIGSVSPHRATSAMARRSARKSSAKRKPNPSSTRAPETSPSKSTGSKLPLAVDEADEDSDNEQVSPIDAPNPLTATRSMPELNESLEGQEYPTAFLHDLIGNQKKAQKDSTLQKSPERSTDAETQSSLSSREYRSWSRFHRSHGETSFRPMAQRAVGVNPPGITIHSQSQSDHAPSHRKTLSDERDNELDDETQPVTLVFGTPSSTSELSQSDKPLDMSQLKRDGQALLNLPDDGTDIATQSIRASDDILVPTQVVGSDAPGIPGDDEQEYLIQALEVSPLKKRGYYSSSSGTSIPGLSTMNETFSQHTPSIPASGGETVPSLPHNVIKNPIKRAVYPVTNLPPPKPIVDNPRRQSAIKVSRPGDNPAPGMYLV
jgi:hypothetical protein